VASRLKKGGIVPARHWPVTKSNAPSNYKPPIRNFILSLDEHTGKWIKPVSTWKETLALLSVGHGG